MDDSDRQVLSTLFGLAQVRKEARIRGGRASVIAHPSSDVKVRHSFSPGASPGSWRPAETTVRATGDTPSPGQVIVEEMMVLAGQVAGSIARRGGVPMLYRTQAPPRFAEATAPAPGVHPLFPSLQQLQHMWPALMSTSPGAHAGLGVPEYVQVTSPIRRYHDMLAHWQLKTLIRGESKPMFTGIELLQMNKALASQVSRVRDLQRNSDQHWLLHHLTQRPADAPPLRGIVMSGFRELGRTDASIVKVHVLDVALRATAVFPIGMAVPPNGAVHSFVVANADLHAGELRLAPVN